METWCQEHGFTVAGVYADDGYSGLYMDRPDFQRMLADCKQGKIDIVVTKDMSRLTRNSTHSGQLRNEFFPKHHIRYIGVTDGVDTGKDDDLIAFRSVFNEIYSKDIGKKVHSSYVIKAKKGKFTGCVAPFGYMKSPEDKNFLIPDKDTAWIVQKTGGRENPRPLLVEQEERLAQPCDQMGKGIRRKGYLYVGFFHNQADTRQSCLYWNDSVTESGLPFQGWLDWR